MAEGTRRDGGCSFGLYRKLLCNVLMLCNINKISPYRNDEVVIN